MMTFITALMPISFLIVLGYFLKRISFLPDGFWSGMEKLTYFVLFPSLLIRTLAIQSFEGTPWFYILLVAIGTTTLSALSLILFRNVMTQNHATFTSVFQGGVRFNTYITLAIAQSLYGATGLALGSVAVGFLVVLVNLWCITIFVIWGSAPFNGVFPIIKKIIANPLIIACFIGGFLSFTGVGLPFVSGDILEIVSRAALPMGLLTVGAALNLKGFKQHLKPIYFSSIMQFGFKPLFTVLLIYSTGLTGVAAAVLLIVFMTPTAPSSYILARQLGGDHETMASIISVQTLLAFITMPLLASLLL